MKRIRTNERFSALCNYRYARQLGLSARIAYWFSVYRNGWASNRQTAWGQIKDTILRLA